jgi:hypothetical protein
MSSGFKLDNLMDVKRGVPTRIVNAVIDLELARRPRACAPATILSNRTRP